MNAADFRDLGINLLASVTLIIVGASSERLIAAWRFRFQRRMWRPFSRRLELGVCLTTRAGPLPRSTRRLSLSEVRALADVIPVISRLRISYRLLEGANADAETLARMNLLVLGSTFVNEVSLEIAEFLRPVLPMTVEKEPRRIIVSGQEYRPTYSSDGNRVIHDHAIIIRTHNPYDTTRSRWALVAMGCHGFGTEGAAQVFLQRDLIRQVLPNADGSAFAAIVSVRIVGRAYDVSIVETYPLGT